MPCGEMSDVKQTQRGPYSVLHLTLAVTAPDLEEFLAFMLEAETSEQGPCQMRPGEKNSFLWLHF